MCERKRALENLELIEEEMRLAEEREDFDEAGLLNEAGAELTAQLEVEGAVCGCGETDCIDNSPKEN